MKKFNIELYPLGNRVIQADAYIKRDGFYVFFLEDDSVMPCLEINAQSVKSIEDITCLPHEPPKPRKPRKQKAETNDEFQARVEMFNSKAAAVT